jgi:dihydroorotate dehydrogenase electron transfer subunit
MRVLQGTFLERDTAWTAYARLRLLVPDLGAVAPGQALLAKQTGRRDPLLPALLLPAVQDLTAHAVECLAYGDVLDAGAPHAAWCPDEHLTVVGPVGRPFQLDARARRILLVGERHGVGALLALAHELARRGTETTFLSWPDARDARLPAVALPQEVEYVLTSSDEAAILRQVDALASWADQLFLAVAPQLLPQTISLLRRRLLRVRRGYAQALFAPQMLPCGVGACDLCAIRLREGYRRLCRDGLVVDLLSLL